MKTSKKIFHNAKYKDGTNFSAYLDKIVLVVDKRQFNIKENITVYNIDPNFIPYTPKIQKISPKKIFFPLLAPEKCTNNNNIIWINETIIKYLEKNNVIHSPALILSILSYFSIINSSVVDDSCSLLNKILENIKTINVEQIFLFKSNCTFPNEMIFFDNYYFGESIENYDFSSFGVFFNSDIFKNNDFMIEKKMKFIRKKHFQCKIVDVAHFTNMLEITYPKYSPIDLIIEQYYGILSQIISSTFWKKLEEISYRINITNKLFFDVEKLFFSENAHLVSIFDGIDCCQTYYINELYNHGTYFFQEDTALLEKSDQNIADIFREESVVYKNDFNNIFTSKLHETMKYISRGNHYAYNFKRYQLFKDSNFEKSLINYVIAWESMFKMQGDSSSTIQKRIACMSYPLFKIEFKALVAMFSLIYSVRSDYVHEGLIRKDKIKDLCEKYSDLWCYYEKASNSYYKGSNNKVMQKFFVISVLNQTLNHTYNRMKKIFLGKMNSHGSFNHVVFLSYLDLVSYKIINDLPLKREELAEICFDLDWLNTEIAKN